MNDIQFNDNQFQGSQNLYQSAEEKGMVGFLMKRGIAKTPQTANAMLLTFAIVLIILSFIIV